MAMTFAERPLHIPSAAETDPIKLGWMVGSPPPPDRIVRFADMTHYRFPQTRWSFSNFRQLIPTTNIARGDGPVSVLPRAERHDIDTLTFFPNGASAPMRWAQSLEESYTDAIIVLRRGTIVYERYFGVMTPNTAHMTMSVTKSFFGLLGAMLVEEGRLDERALVPEYVPELAGSAYGDATVRQLLDMRIGVRYSEDYTDPNAEFWQHMRASGIFPQPDGYSGPRTTADFLKSLKKEGEHGGAFLYKSVNTDVLGWIIRHVTGESSGETLSRRFWQKLGVEHDGYMVVDIAGSELAGGGLNITLRDMARFGEMMRLEGRFNGNDIVPKSVIDDIRTNGSREAFARGNEYPILAGGSYRNMWWLTNNEHGAYSARGIHRQVIHIDPEAEMTIARFASHPIASDPNLDTTSQPSFHALALHLMKTD
jgi:CubicO group peptidase (beta-lactamase class C family)